MVFQCNTNVVAGVDGGSIMYMTCYVSKNASDENSKDYAKAGKIMIKKTREASANDKDNDNDLQIKKNGVRALMGACLLSTKANTVSAPMASFLLQNGSRFMFSHDFQYVSIQDFDTQEDDCVQLASINGSTILKSVLANYLFRPERLKNMCVYGFNSMYTTKTAPVERTTNDPMRLGEEHPSNGRLNIMKRKKLVVPITNFLNFPDTKFFDGFTFNQDLSILEDNDQRKKV